VGIGTPNNVKSQRIHLVASQGGHLELLEYLAPAFADVERVWVTEAGSRASDLRSRDERVIELPTFNQKNISVRAFVRGSSAAFTERPKVVITTGAGIAIPFVLTSRLLGGRVIFVEDLSRVTNGSLTGRLLSRIAARTYVQWPELLGVYRGATVCDPPQLQMPPQHDRTRGRGTLVMVGTHADPFTRLIDAVLRAARSGLLPVPVIVQAGNTPVADRSVRAVSMLPRDALLDAIGSAEIVISHGGSGSMASVVRAGKRPLVMPRLARHGEHFDDHQEQLVDKLGGLGLVVPITREITAADVALSLRAPTASAISGHASLEVELRKAASTAGRPR
jgi:UDP-N-acetylglucosamine--N-acetylmuramyl-(pentapeptide) pyrophosphoryl-undecaprenol N-acetylglucosamine transferase